MTTTKVNICNEALNMIGAEPIQSFEQNTKNAMRCASIYDSSRKALIRMHPWSFAKKRVKLSPVTTTPTFGYSHSFPLPSDFIRVIDTGAIEYEIEGRYILANSNQINLVYVSDQDNEQLWDSLFAECMALYLVHKLAKAITGSNAEADSAWQKLQNTLKQARTINGQERPSQNLSDSYTPSLIGARY